MRGFSETLSGKTPTRMDVDIIYSYFPNLAESQKQQFAQLGKVYADWNQKINVVSRKDVEQLYLRHVLHSLGLAKFISFQAGSKILDGGTGGGFPGIPLAILFPDSEFHLVDSIGKKIRVVQDVIQELGLTNAQGEQIRMEEVKGRYDFVVSRAVAPLRTLIHWTQSKLLRKSQHVYPNGLICLKGGDLGAEIKESGRKHIEVEELKDYFGEDFFETKKVVYVPFG